MINDKGQCVNDPPDWNGPKGIPAPSHCGLHMRALVLDCVRTWRCGSCGYDRGVIGEEERTWHEQWTSPLVAVRTRVIEEEVLDDSGVIPQERQEVQGQGQPVRQEAMISAFCSWCGRNAVEVTGDVCVPCQLNEGL